MSRSVPLSVRITDDDAAFLADYKADGARTPSEKLRAILADARKLHDPSGDYAGGVEQVSALLQPALSRVRNVQRAERLRSDLVARLYERVPELVAALMLGPSLSDGDSAQAKAKALTAFEAELAQHVFALIEEMLDLGLTRSARTYDPDLITNQADPILDLLDLIRTAKQQQGDTPS